MSNSLPESARTILEKIRAGFPLIEIISWEEDRVCEHLGLICMTEFDPPRHFTTWSVTEGFSDGADGPGKAKDDPLGALDYIIQNEEKRVFLLKDFHHYMRDDHIVRRLRDAHSALQDSDRCIILLGAVTTVPPELVKDVLVVDYDLPDVDEVGQIVETALWSMQTVDGEQMAIREGQRTQILRMFLGLTRDEIRRTIKKITLSHDVLDMDCADEIIEEKRQILRKTEILDFIPTTDDLDQVGGLAKFKEWSKIREKGFSEEARAFGLPMPKGILLTGISGCGKSLAITCLAHQWRLPLVRLDMGRVFAGFVGSPEESLRRAIMTAEAISPSILWIDEIEMGISVFSDSVESGSTSRIFASFLTWMQEKSKPVFIAATANDIDRLPPEFIRKGRFDEVFFVDLPGEKEREEIFRIHLLKRKQNPARTSLNSLAKSTKGFSGAEIEQALADALYEAFYAGKDLDIMDIYRITGRMVPLSVTMKEQITKIKRWADNRAVKANAE